MRDKGSAEGRKVWFVVAQTSPTPIFLRSSVVFVSQLVLRGFERRLRVPTLSLVLHSPPHCCAYPFCIPCSPPALQSPAMDINNLLNRTGQPEDESKKHKCTWADCNKEFTRRSDMVRHQRSHTGEKPFACTWPGCTRRFIQRSALTVHYRVHTGEKPHICEVESCRKAFADVRCGAEPRLQKYVVY